MVPGEKQPEEQRREQIIQAAFTVATRERLDQLTIRKVAAEAHLSTGLVFFHFKTKEALLYALLDWLLQTMFEVWEVDSSLPPRERLFELLRQDLLDAYQQGPNSAKLELFFSFWIMGLRDPVIKARISQAIEQAREIFRPAVRDLLASEPEHFAGVTEDGLLSLMTAIAEGCPLQAVQSDYKVSLEQTLAALRALLLLP
ncbi:TetR family transcriptional regulator [Thermosporothrix hazakensis]|jgi:AcrR family transcriptional regulator|uniref:TetR family transcriptional regulator n=1 Tax=Thermosporothrix hazakensis TaxID=644383 RepID=A0A326U8W4_THEHA|nr:TetR family transcriptional regulator [Thermosporothrix hazakensis]PZW32561.1 TetR family transcriptional regulator [Thermosporothrix hazakensis]GCE49914.1 hypothetical protein KTH_47830 [Thermosporothrix hazakensis]